MKHLALAVSDQERSRHFYETYFGFDAEPALRYDGGVLMLYNADGFSLALGPTEEPISPPDSCTSGFIFRALTRCGPCEAGSPRTESRSSKSGKSRTT